MFILSAWGADGELARNSETVYKTRNAILERKVPL